MDKRNIPIAAPIFCGNEKKYVMDCMDSTWISSKGKYIPLFEQKFAEVCQVKHAIGVMNGTVALHVALLALGIGPGDEVILPTFTYVATANCVKYVGATPVFIDSEPITWNLDTEQIEQHITSRTKAIIAVHIYGHPSDMNSILKIAQKYNLYVVEDAAEAHGAMINNRPVGSFGHISIFSFFGNKIITSGEGGMVVTNDSELANKVSQLKGQGVDPNKRYWFPIIGYNYRMTNIQAAIGLAQLENMDWHVSQRRRIVETYKAFLEDAVGIRIQPEVAGYKNSYWMTSILVDQNLPQRDVIIAELAECGIETRPFFYPMHLLPMYADKEDIDKFPIATNIAAQGLNLPTFANLTEEDIKYVCDNLRLITDTN